MVIDKGSEGRSRRALVLMAVALLIPLVIGWVVVWNGRDDDDAGLSDARALWDCLLYTSPSPRDRSAYLL